jgi:hypothetical protein
MLNATDRRAAVAKHLIAMHYNALHLTEIPNAAYSILSRCLNTGVLLMIAVIKDHLKVPVIPLTNLIDFFDKTSTPSDTEQYWINIIRTWMLQMAGNSAFCTERVMSAQHQTIYITSPSTAVDDGTSILRVKKSRNNLENIPLAIGSIIAEKYGQTLRSQCHMGPELSIYGNAIAAMINDFRPDFRLLISNRIHQYAAHIKKLRLEETFPLVKNLPDSETPIFARDFIYNGYGGAGDASEESARGVVGVNVFSLLLMVSLGATDIQQNINNNVAHSIVKQILLHTPISTTPGGVCMLQTFSVYDTNPNKIIMHKDCRPWHLLRPVQDSRFITTGNLTHAKTIDRFLPEDMFHCPFLIPMKNTLMCNSILHIPGSIVCNSYSILSNVHYPIWNPLTKTVGSIIREQRDDQVLLKNEAGAVIHVLSSDNWEQEMNGNNYIILPMIMRAGACVYYTDDAGVKKAGLLYPFQFHKMDGRFFKAETASYQYIKEFDNDQRVNYNKIPREASSRTTAATIPRTVSESHERAMAKIINLNTPKRPVTPSLLHTIKVIDVVESLIPVGTYLYIHRETNTFKAITDHIIETDRDKHFLRVRLNVPPSSFPFSLPHMVYVTYKTGKNMMSQTTTSTLGVTIEALVQDLTVDPPPRDDIMTMLCKS